jgi:peptidoglycan/xylan/chitin deacetylase (PgdA/CDA1 family)
VEEITATSIHSPDVLSRLAEWRPDLGLALGGPILKPSLFEIPPLGTLNVHSGRVPDYRGAPPAFWELDTGATEIGATIHWINTGLDTGDIIQQGIARIYPEDRLEDVEARVSELGHLLLGRALRQVVAGEAPRVPQPPGGRTYRMPVLRKRLSTLTRLKLARFRRALRPRSILKSVFYLGYLGVVTPVRSAFRTILRRQPVRIFTYHRVTDLCRDGMSIPPTLFARQLRYILRSHDIVPLSEALRLLQERVPLTRPVAVITFDDGYRSVLKAAKPIMDSLNVTGTCFVVTDLVGTDARLQHDADDPVREHHDLMDWHELGALLADGWEIGGHTATHARMSTLSSEAIHDELSRSLIALRDRLGLADIVFAYPFGRRTDITEEARQTAKELGFQACLGNYGGVNTPDVDPFHLNRKDVGGPHATLGWKSWIHGFTRS